MTGALVIYSATFMRYSLAVQPKNYLLFACHFINEGAQLTQGYRYLQYWQYVTTPNPPRTSLRRLTCFIYPSPNSWGGREQNLKQEDRDNVAEKS